MTDANAVIDDVLATVDRLRIETGPDAKGRRQWLGCHRLLTDADRLGAVVRAIAAGRGVDELAALSVFVQGYAFRMASVAIGSFVISGDVVSVDPERTSLAIERFRPSAVWLEDVGLVTADGDPTVLHRELVDGHLAPLVDAARAVARVGRPLLWANIGSACAESFEAFVGPSAPDAGRIRGLAETFFATARPELARSGRLARIGDRHRWAWERKACCLWYRTEVSGGVRCGDCSLWTDAERQARYAERDR
ncbi:MAG: IucA/IucC family C-terminal-domain containing protein [Actinomycetota bacterium]